MTQGGQHPRRSNRKAGAPTRFQHPLLRRPVDDHYRRLGGIAHSGKDLRMSEPLTAHDRCDACSAAAAVRATKQRVPDTLEELEFGKPTIMVLLFCGHHHKQHFDKLVDEGWAFG